MPAKTEIIYDLMQEPFDIADRMTFDVVQSLHYRFDGTAMSVIEPKRAQSIAKCLRSIRTEPQLLNQSLPRHAAERQCQPTKRPRCVKKPVPVDPPAAGELYAVVDNKQVACREQPKVTQIRDKIRLHDRYSRWHRNVLAKTLE